MGGELALRQASLQLPLTLALPARRVTQALPPEVPATRVAVGEGVAPATLVGVGEGVAPVMIMGVAVGVCVGVGGAIGDAPSSRAMLVAIAAICRLSSGISATCVSSAVSLFITTLDATEVAVGVGVATGVARPPGTDVAVGVDVATGVVRPPGADVAVGVGVAVVSGADVAVGVGVAVARGVDVAVGVAVVVAAQNGNPIFCISLLSKPARRDRGIHPVS